MSDGSTEPSGELKNVSNFRSTDKEVSSAAKSLAVNLCRNIVDGLNESLIPLRDSACEVWSSSTSTNLGTISVYKETWSTRPVASLSSCTVNEVSKDLTVNLKSNLLGENAGKLNLCVKVVVGVKVLT